jgi:enoyl-CoA hydratase/carnithine racemase
MLRVEADGPVLRVTLARPEVRNALNDELIAALASTFETLDPAIRVVVIAGDGPSFCAGGDLEWMRKAAAYTVEQNEADARKIARMFGLIATCKAPVIARIHGAAFGGGSGLAAAVDVAVAASNAKFAFSEVKLGLVAATISPFVLGKIGASHARALFTTGEVFGAARALSIGLVHEVHEEADLDAAVEAKIASILSSGPEAVAVSKRLASEPPLDSEASARLLAHVRAGDEAREGIQAFLEKRVAAFVVKR